MKATVAFFLIAVSMPSMASALPQSLLATAKANTFSVSQTQLGVLLDDPRAKSILMKYIPDVIRNDQIAMARGMTLKALQAYAAESVTDAKLAAIQLEFTRLNSNHGPD